MADGMQREKTLAEAGRVEDVSAIMSRNHSQAIYVKFGAIAFFPTFPAVRGDLKQNILSSKNLVKNFSYTCKRNAKKFRFL